VTRHTLREFKEYNISFLKKVQPWACLANFAVATTSSDFIFFFIVS
jgi:hypothetical protein